MPLAVDRYYRNGVVAFGSAKTYYIKLRALVNDTIFGVEL